MNNGDSAVLSSSMTGDEQSKSTNQQISETSHKTDCKDLTEEVDPSDDSPVTSEQTRSTVALLFIIGFFAVLFLCFAYAITIKASLSELKDILVAIIGALSGTLGFIVGYYYKSSK